MSRRQQTQQRSHCNHNTLHFETSPHAKEVGYERRTAQQRANAATEGRAKGASSSEDFFPAPLVLPGDELSLDPNYPPQTLRSWLRDKDRNEVDHEKNVVYLAVPPFIDPDIDYLWDWSRPQNLGRESSDQASDALPLTPSLEGLFEYLTAFYHGLPVKLLPSGLLRFSAWDDNAAGQSQSKKGRKRPQYVGLNTSKECIGIRTRRSPDGIFTGQLNLDDLLETAMSVLPDDAYALLMLVDHDLYEDEDDDFCCGRAYGGSRVAVVSSARYNPVLDLRQNVEREHAWPASHCDDYAQQCCGTPLKKRKVESLMPTQVTAAPSPLQAAVLAIDDMSGSNAPLSTKQLSGLWLSRVCQTASHELGHCFGMDHCVYYACIMQGTASLSEDVRQPPYLCPIDLMKLLRATSADERARYEALANFCERHSNSRMFVAFGTWIRCRLQQISQGTGVSR